MGKPNDIYSLLKKDEITLKDIAIVFQVAIKTQLKLVAGLFIFFISLAYVDYSFSPAEYQSDANVLLSGGTPAPSAAGALAGMLTGTQTPVAGAGGAIGPDMYGRIVATQAFLNALVVSKFPKDASGKDSTTLEQYFANGAPLTFSQKVGNLPTYIKQIFSKPAPVVLDNVSPVSKKIDTTKVVQNEISAEMFFSSKVPPLVELQGVRASVINIVRPRILIKIDDTGANVSVNMPDPFIAAAVNKLLLQQLIDYVTAYNTIKQRTNIAFLEKRFQESKAEYTSKQKQLAGIRDNSFGVILQSAQTNQEVLSNEMGIAYNIYNQFAVQLEMAKIELKKETPLFSVLEPISIPAQQVEPVLFAKLIKYSLFALVFSILFIGYRLVFPKKA